MQRNIPDSQAQRGGQARWRQPPSAWNLFDPDVLRWLLERTFSLELLRQFSELRIAIEPAAVALAASHADGEAIAAIEAGYRRMEAAEAGDDDVLESDIAFHVAMLDAARNPFFYSQFRDVVRPRCARRFVSPTASRGAAQAFPPTPRCLMPSAAATRQRRGQP